METRICAGYRVAWNSKPTEILAMGSENEPGYIGKVLNHKEVETEAHFGAKWNVRLDASFFISFYFFISIKICYSLSKKYHRFLIFIL